MTIQIEGGNVGQAGKTTGVDADRYVRMRRAVVAVTPDGPPGLRPPGLRPPGLHPPRSSKP